MSEVNRKIITSTGFLLKSLYGDKQNSIGSNMPLQGSIHSTDMMMNNSLMHINTTPSNMSPDNNNINRYQKKSNPYSYTNPSKNVPHHHHHHQQQQQQQQQHHHHAAQQHQQPVVKQRLELPETFGLPSDTKSRKQNLLNQNIPKYTTSSTNVSTSSIQNSSVSISSTTAPNVSQSAPSLSVKPSDNDIEIIDHIPSSAATNTLSSSTNVLLSNTNVTKTRLNKNLSLTQFNTDENFKNYLSQTYNFDLQLSCKPQCNFVSNLTCIDQMLNKCKYNEKKRHLNTASKSRLNTLDVDEDADDAIHRSNNSSEATKIKKQKVIVIDDTDESSDEVHKPWITPGLVNLIKQRNLLQSKLHDDPNPELLNKFKNLRNKVTKLVKNARKEYLAKMVKEKKEKELNNEFSSENNKDSVDKQLSDTTSKSTLSTVSSSTTTHQSQSSTSLQQQQQPQVSITQDQSTIMMNLYNTFFNQYMQQYATQQKPVKPADSTNSEQTYEYLTNQAAFYAKQQQGIQSQLETCLVKTIRDKVTL